MECFEIVNFEVIKGIPIEGSKQFCWVKKGNLRQFVQIGGTEKIQIPLWRWVTNAARIDQTNIKIRAGNRILFIPQRYTKQQNNQALVLIREHQAKWRWVYPSTEKYPLVLIDGIWENQAWIYEYLFVLKPNNIIENDLVYVDSTETFSIQIIWDGIEYFVN